MNTLLENIHLKRLLSLEREKSSCSAVKENAGDSLSTSCAASPSSPKLQTEPSANQVNDNSLQVSFDNGKINNSSIQVSCNEEAGEDSSFNISFEEVDQDTTQSDWETDPPVSNNHDIVYEKMCSSPKNIVLEEELLKLFGRCLECGDEVLEKELLEKGGALKVTTLCKNSHSKEWVSQPLVNRAAARNELLSGAILFTGNTFSRVSEVASAINLASLRIGLSQLAEEAPFPCYK